MTYHDKIKRIAHHYGFRHQAIKAAEESSELSVALCKLVGGEGGRAAVVEEMADVMIMVEQMQYLMRVNNAELREVMTDKVERQLGRMKDNT